MAITIDHLTRVILVPQSFLTLVSGTLYELDVDALRIALKDLEDDADGMLLDDTHRHNTEVALSGVVYARSVEVINGYTVEFEDGQYTVRCTGANHNLADVKVANQVSLIVGNSAGLQTVTAGSGVTAQDMLDIAQRVWEKLGTGGIPTLDILESARTAAEAAVAGIGSVDGKVDGMVVDVAALLQIETGRWKIANNQLTIYDATGLIPMYVFNLKDATDAPSSTSVFERVPA